jgi:hypothetical protein
VVEEDYLVLVPFVGQGTTGLVAAERNCRFVGYDISQGYLDILNVFSSMTPEQRADVGDGVTMIGRWHDTNSRSGVAIMETTDLAALNRYLGKWNPFMDLDVSPVLDDEETAALAKNVLADHNHGG